MKKKISILFVFLITLFLSSCTIKNKYEYVEGKVNVVATTTMLGDLAENIGKDNISITTLMAVGVDPHSFVPRPSVTNAVKEADLVLINGLNLEAKMGKVLQMLNPEKVLVISDFLDEDKLIKDENDEYDPHVWFNIQNWVKASIALKDKLIKLDSTNKEQYINNTNNYINKLNLLEEEIISLIETLDQEKRVLITAHDAFSYFGETYGFEVFAIQGISTETEPSVKDIQSLANLIVELNVKAMFFESSTPETTIRSVMNAARIKGHSVTVGGTLYADSLGNKNGDGGTYINMVRTNVKTIVEQLK